MMSPSRPISAPAWFRTGRPTMPARDTRASRTARLASRRWLRWRRRAPPIPPRWAGGRVLASDGSRPMGVDGAPPSGGSVVDRVGRESRARRRTMGHLCSWSVTQRRCRNSTWQNVGHLWMEAAGRGRIERDGAHSTRRTRTRPPAGGTARQGSISRCTCARESVVMLPVYWGVLHVSSATPPSCSSAPGF